MPTETQAVDAQPDPAQRELRFASGELLLGTFAPGEPDRIDAPQMQLAIDTADGGE